VRRQKGPLRQPTNQPASASVLTGRSVWASAGRQLRYSDHWQQDFGRKRQCPKESPWINVSPPPPSWLRTSHQYPSKQDSIVLKSSSSALWRLTGIWFMDWAVNSAMLRYIIRCQMLTPSDGKPQGFSREEVSVHSYVQAIFAC
jgi:hypothetical protein